MRHVTYATLLFGTTIGSLGILEREGYGIYACRAQTRREIVITCVRSREITSYSQSTWLCAGFDFSVVADTRVG